METIEKLTVKFIIAMMLVTGIAGLVIWCSTNTWWNGMMGAIGLLVAYFMINDYKKEYKKEE